MDRRKGKPFLTNLVLYHISFSFARALRKFYQFCHNSPIPNPIHSFFRFFSKPWAKAAAK